MTLSFWRYSHLCLAICSAAFLIIASVTGTILAIDTIQEKTLPYKVENFENINLQESLPQLRKVYPEITELSIDHNQFVTLKAIDKEGNDVDAYINPLTGKIIGATHKKSEFIQWITSLHRSLFLHEAGRIFIGINAFLLLLISISGFVLVLKRQKGIRNFFSKIVKDYFTQYYHVVLGRLALIPILIIALTGVYLSLERFHFFDSKEEKENKTEEKITVSAKNKLDFKTTKLAEITKIEFPFSDDPEDYYIFELKDRKIEVEQYSAEIINEERFATAAMLAELSLDLHTGRANAFWAIILGIASLNILFFIYSGFDMTFKRRASRIKNKFKAEESKYILLVGSENGSTLRFANAIYKQLLAHGEKVFLGEMNKYSIYPKAEHLIVLASTHGLGDPPSNANRFLSLVNKYPQSQKIKVSVLGFGSKAYPNFCGFAKEIDTALTQQNWAERILELQTVNDKSVDDFIQWVELWNSKTGILFSTTPSLYNQVPKGLQKLMVLDKTLVSETEHSYILTLRPNARTKFESGDLLAVYPANDSRERLYSIGKHTGNIQLVVKLHPNGLGSGYLYASEIGSVIKARIIKNNSFHFPKSATQVAFISNGTGIAPFLGMIEQNKNKTPIHMYSGFRNKTETVLAYEKFANEMMTKQQLQSFHLALSKEANHDYVMNLVKRDAEFFVDLLNQGGVIMICGALAMQKDVEITLDEILKQKTQNVADYKAKRQILTDCY